jgi:hypothetical protein
MGEEIEYETVTLKIPKRLMAFLRCNTQTPVEQYLEYTIVESVRADVDAEVFALGPREIAESANLNPIFKEITGTEIL